LISASSSHASLGHVTRIEFIPEPRPDGTIVLRAAVLPPSERIRRLLDRLTGRKPSAKR
jgi:hypothetical protein